MAMDKQSMALANLSPPQRRALDRLLRERNVAIDALPIGHADAASGVFPLSFAQQRIWLTTELAADKGLYNVPWPMRIRGPLDPAALERGINAIVRRHGALRTAVVVRDGQPLQTVVPDATVPFARLDLRMWPEPARQDEARRRLRQEARRPFDFERPPLVRALLVQTGDEEHLLLLTVHHIAADGASGLIMRRELAELYDAACTGREPVLPELPIQYVDYAVWQREHLTKERLADLVGDWRARLGGAPPVLELPADRPRPAMQTFRGARRPWRIPAALTEKLQRLGRRHGATMFMVLLAAFKTLLLRHTGQTDIAVGAPVANRTRAEIEPLIGCFINTLVLRTDLRGDPTFRELLDRERRVCTDAYAHQELPFERLVEELQTQRDLSRHPLVQVTLQLQHAPGHALDLAGVDITPIAIGHATSPFDISMLMFQTDDGLDAVVEYSTDLFDPGTIDRLIARYERLLWGAVENPGTRLSEMPLLARGEERQMLTDWNVTAERVPDRCVHELVEAQRADAPDAVAVADPNQQLTYHALNARANQLAHYLQAAGVGPEVRVAVCLGRSTDLAVGILAILKAGGTYVPLDATHPASRIALILAETDAKVLLTLPPFTTRLADSPCRVTCLTRDARDIAAMSQENPPRRTAPDGLAYVMYTSGSTGQPKGVCVTHRSVISVVRTIQRDIGFTATDVMAAVTALTFDIAGLELFLPWSAGGRVALMSREAGTEGARLSERLMRARATVMQATPSTWRLLRAGGWSGDRHLLLLCGGERLPDDLVRELHGRCAGLWNLYGPTETTIWSTSAKVDTAAATVSIGRPLGNTHVYVVDAAGRPVPIGVDGELHICGAGVARGYLNRPALTAEKFVPDAFSGHQGARAYRTGDVVRWRPEGQLDFVGRRDHQVKVRGFRIEPGEIEHALRAHGDVRDAVIVVREDEPHDVRVVAYVIVTDTAVGAEELSAHLRRLLPDHMVPATFVNVPSFPLNSSGKIDRAALPAPVRLSPAPQGSVRPRSELEHIIAGVWQDVLQASAVGQHDGFFALGGNSLLLVRVLEKLRAHLGANLSLVDLFRYPTVHDLARHLAPTHLTSASDEAHAGARLARRRQQRAQARRSPRPRVAEGI